MADILTFKGFRRNGPFALDSKSQQASYAAALEFAHSDAAAYPGMIVSVNDPSGKASAVYEVTYAASGSSYAYDLKALSFSVAAEQFESVYETKAEAASSHSSLENKIISEASRAEAAEAAMSVRYNAAAGALSSEIIRAKAAEAAVGASFSSFASLVSNEASSRESGDEALAASVSSAFSAVSAEASRAQAAEAAVSSSASSALLAVSSEYSRALSAEGGLLSAISSANSSISALASSLSSEAVLRQAGDDAILGTKGEASGIAPLGPDGTIPSRYLPSYVDDVKEYASLSAFPESGEADKIYFADDTGKTYRWGGSKYIAISETVSLGETESTAYPGSLGKANSAAIEAIKASDAAMSASVSSNAAAISSLSSSVSELGTSVSTVGGAVAALSSSVVSYLEGTSALPDGSTNATREWALSSLSTLTEITYAGLNSLVSSKSLVPGRKYRITDYAPSYSYSGMYEDCRMAGNAFDIIVEAESASVLSTDCRFAHHSGDTYFASCDLSQWQGKYILNPTTVKSSSQHGLITWLRDEKGNEAFYDFKNLLIRPIDFSIAQQMKTLTWGSTTYTAYWPYLFNRNWCYTFCKQAEYVDSAGNTVSPIDASISSVITCKNNIILPSSISKYGYYGNDTYYPSNVFLFGYAHYSGSLQPINSASITSVTVSGFFNAIGPSTDNCELIDSEFAGISNSSFMRAKSCTGLSILNSKNTELYSCSCDMNSANPDYVIVNNCYNCSFSNVTSCHFYHMVGCSNDGYLANVHFSDSSDSTDDVIAYMFGVRISLPDSSDDAIKIYVSDTITSKTPEEYARDSESQQYFPYTVRLYPSDVSDYNSMLYCQSIDTRTNKTLSFDSDGKIVFAWDDASSVRNYITRARTGSTDWSGPTAVSSGSSKTDTTTTSASPSTGCRIRSVVLENITTDGSEPTLVSSLDAPIPNVTADTYIVLTSDVLSDDAIAAITAGTLYLALYRPRKKRNGKGKGKGKVERRSDYTLSYATNGLTDINSIQIVSTDLLTAANGGKYVRKKIKFTDFVNIMAGIATTATDRLAINSSWFNRTRMLGAKGRFIPCHWMYAPGDKLKYSMNVPNMATIKTIPQLLSIAKLTNGNRLRHDAAVYYDASYSGSLSAGIARSAYAAKSDTDFVNKVFLGKQFSLFMTPNANIDNGKYGYYSNGSGSYSDCLLVGCDGKSSESRKIEGSFHSCKFGLVIKNASPSSSTSILSTTKRFKVSKSRVVMRTTLMNSSAATASVRASNLMSTDVLYVRGLIKDY